MLYIIVLFAALTTDTTEINVYSNTLYIYLSLINFLVSILMRMFMAYKFPILFVSLTIIFDPLCNKIIIKCCKAVVKCCKAVVKYCKHYL